MNFRNLPQNVKNAVRAELIAQFQYILENAIVKGSFVTVHGAFALFEITDLSLYKNAVAGEIKITVYEWGTEVVSFQGAETVASTLMLMLGYIRNQATSRAYPAPIAPSAALTELLPVFAEKRAAKRAQMIAEYNAKKSK